MAHWSETWIGRPYVPGEADCARLVCDVRRQVFSRPVPPEADAERAASAYGRARQTADVIAGAVEPVASPREGDVVLMRCRGRPSHVGVYCWIDGEAYVLHALKNAGQVVLHRLRDLPRVFLAVEGFYRWK